MNLAFLRLCVVLVSINNPSSNQQSLDSIIILLGEYLSLGGWAFS